MKTFDEYKEIIKSMEIPYEKKNEEVRLALINLIDAWEEDRKNKR